MVQMDIPSVENRPVNQGRNMRSARERKYWTQEMLADKSGLHQSDISRMECSPIIEDEAKLQKIADALECPVAFIKEHSLDDTIQYYQTINTNMAENTETGSAYNIKEQYIYNPVDKIEALYERLLASKDERIKELEARVQQLQAGK
ncbi:MAG: helix-turn-helix transcriptional regulator [Dysgonomonas sp.]|nr:helix-turn-helix transcriptional regulator [Dysgonomonas sp.]